MSAQIRILPQSEADQGFGLLKDIVEMVKNPKAIDEAYERRRKAAQMTDAEVVKADEARALIAKGDVLKNELEEQKKSLDIAKSEHESTISLHLQHAQSASARLAEWESRLNSISEHNTKNENDLIEEKRKFSEETKKHQEEIEVAKANILSQKEDIKNEILINKSEKGKLIAWEERLKAKAGRLAAEAAN